MITLEHAIREARDARENLINPIRAAERAMERCPNGSPTQDSIKELASGLASLTRQLNALINHLEMVDEL